MKFNYSILCEEIFDEMLLESFFSHIFNRPEFKKIKDDMQRVEKENKPAMSKLNDYRLIKKELIALMRSDDYLQVNKLFVKNDEGKELLTPVNAKKLNELIERLVNVMIDKYGDDFRKLSSEYLNMARFQAH
jgi:ABC-type iron transport system FetAB ATPase subunit